MDAVPQITDTLQSLGFDPRASEVPDAKGRAWLLQRQGVLLLVSIGEREGRPVLQLDSPILFMPTQDLLPFYRKLLGLNRSLPGLALAIEKDVVHVVGDQILEGLTAQAAAACIQETLRLADALGDLLMAEFPGSRFWGAG